MYKLDELLENNRRWAKGLQQDSPATLKTMALGQDPKFLWIGCSDSRVLAINSLGLGPGDIFVHRNIANQAKLDDGSCQSVLQFVTTALAVEQILVCGHYGCGGVNAALANQRLGSDLDNWLSDLKDFCQMKAVKYHSDKDLAKRMVEEHVRHQVKLVASSPHIQAAWKNGRDILIHGLVFDVATGLIQDLGCSVSGDSEKNLEQRDSVTKV